MGWGDKKTTQWVNCALFGKRAKALAPYLSKGDAVTVSGELTLETYEKRDGGMGASLKLNVAEIAMQGGSQGKQQPDPNAPLGNESNGPDLDDEIPFK